MLIPAAQRLRRIIWWSAFYDLVVTLPFAFPWTARLNLEALTMLHAAGSFSGHMPAFEPLHLFFVNLMGSVVTVWAVLRLRDPLPHYAVADGFARMCFATWMMYYWLGQGATGVLGIFLVPEIGFAVVQLYAWRLAQIAASERGQSVNTVAAYQERQKA